MRRSDEEPFVIAVACADLHLRHDAPVARADLDWYKAMERPIHHVGRLADQYDCPILCAGDVFHTSNQPAELVNWAIRELPHMYAIPGQHDLPHHRYEDITRSSYWTLVEAHTITDLHPGQWHPIGDYLRVAAFPWGYPAEPAPNDQPLLGINVALIHEYIWMESKGYPGAPPTKHVSKWPLKLKGYSVAVSGDNHQGFLKQVGDCMFLNVGGFMRTKTDQKDYQPKVGLIWSDGSVSRVKLDTSKDILLEKEELIRKTIEKSGSFDDFLERVRKLESSKADFEEAVEEAAREAKPEVRDAITRALEKK